MTRSILLLLVLLGGSALLQAQPTAAGRFQFNPDLQPFYHGVASGDPTASSVVIWTRITPEVDGPVLLDYRLALDTAFSQLIAAGQVTAEPDRDYTVSVEVGDLQPGTTYYYHFSDAGRHSLIGRARTLPEEGVDHLRMAVVSCSNYEGGYFKAYAGVAARNDLDAVIHLGDYIYEYPAGVYGFDLPDRQNEPLHELLTLADYRTRYSLYRLDPDLIRAHQQHTFITVWDDHESANDSYVSGAENHTEGVEGSWEERKAISRRVYHEWMPMRGGSDEPIYRSFAFGDLMELFMLDTRLEGREAPPPNFDTPDDPPRRIISDTQFSWLTDGLKSSDADWKVIGNQVLFSTTNFGFAGGFRDGTPNPTNIDSIRQAENIFIDNWESYPTQRNAIIDTLFVNGIDNVVIVTGDSHSSWAFDVTAEPVRYPVPEALNLPQPNPYDPATGQGYDPDSGLGSRAVEFATPSVSSPNFDEAVGTTLAAQFESIVNQPIPPFGLEYNPHMKYVDLDRHGYFVLDLRPDTAQADYFYLSSQLLDSLDESFGQAVFTVNGSNRAELRSEPAAEKADAPAAAPLLPFGFTTPVRDVVGSLLLFSVYPNPATDLLLLQLGLNAQVSLQLDLYDSGGRRVAGLPAQMTGPGLQQIGMELPQLPAGLYTLRITAGTGEVLVRQVVVR